MIKQYLEAGKIVGTHGVRGELRVESWCDSPEQLKSLPRLYFDEGRKPLTVLSGRVHKNHFLMTLEGVTSVEQADALRGTVVYLNREDLPLEPGRHFIQDLMGLTAVDGITGQEYGVLTQVIPTGANDVYRIVSKEGKEFLFPAVPHMIQRVELEAGLIRLLPIPGIFDGNGETVLEGEGSR